MILYCLKQMIIFIFLFFHATLFSNGNISFLPILQEKTVNYQESWYLDLFSLEQQPIKTGKNTNIVILDTETEDHYSNCVNLIEFDEKSANKRVFIHSRPNTQKNKKRSSELMKKNRISPATLKKNHGSCTVQVIRKLAPEATIISIPVLDDRGGADKEGVYQALKLAKTYNPDILHLGFQILDFDMKQNLDKKIYKLLKKFTFVIVPSGNNLKSDFPPKLPNIFCVASFGKKNNNYPISEFCQNISKADFIMPGENIEVAIWDFKKNQHSTLFIFGTSFSASFMTGFLAILFEKNNKKIPKIKADLLKLSTFLEEDWQDKIRYGFPHF